MNGPTLSGPDNVTSFLSDMPLDIIPDSGSTPILSFPPPLVPIVPLNSPGKEFLFCTDANWWLFIDRKWNFRREDFDCRWDPQHSRWQHVELTDRQLRPELRSSEQLEADWFENFERLSSYLATTKKVRESHCAPAGPSPINEYEKDLETCESELVELRLQLQKLQEEVTRAEFYRTMLKALVREQRIHDQQPESLDDEMELQQFLDVYLASSSTWMLHLIVIRNSGLGHVDANKWRLFCRLRFIALHCLNEIRKTNALVDKEAARIKSG